MSAKYDDGQLADLACYELGEDGYRSTLPEPPEAMLAHIRTDDKEKARFEEAKAIAYAFLNPPDDCPPMPSLKDFEEMQKEQEKRPADAHEMVQIVALSEGPGWVHTTGMELNFGLPELEIFDIPRFMYPAAGQILYGACDYLLNSGKTIEVGTAVQLGRLPPLQFIESPGQPDCVESRAWYTGRNVWRLVDLPVSPHVCEHCAKSDKEHLH